MPSVYVMWSGECADANRRQAIGERIASVANLAAGLIEQRHQNSYDGRIEGVVIADKGLFPSELVNEVSKQFVLVPPVYLRGNLFRLANSGDDYPGEDRVSFVFASILDEGSSPQRPSRGDGILVWPEDARQCKLYVDPTIARADWYLRKPAVHLRYFAEAWMTRLLEFIRHFHMPELWYWNNEDLSGAHIYNGIDPNDEAARETEWRKVLTGLLGSIEHYLPKELTESLGRELPAMRQHLLRNGEIPRSWWTTPYERLEMKLAVAEDLSSLERSEISRCLMFAYTEFDASARQAIRDAGKGLNLAHVPLRFNGMDLSLRSHFSADDQFVHVEVGPIRDAPLHQAIAEGEAQLLGLRS